MKPQEAISILMLSPCYWRLKLADRKELVREFMANYATLEMPFESDQRKRKTDN